MAVLVVFAVRASLPLQSGAAPVDPPSFPETSEFPTATSDGRLALEDAAAQFLRDAGWSSVTNNPRGSDIGGIEVLTLGGRRAGVYGLLFFEEPANLPPDSGFVFCGEILEVRQSGVGATSVKGLYIAMLDGRTQPYHMLPSADGETLPQSRDLAGAGAGKCAESATP